MWQAWSMASADVELVRRMYDAGPELQSFLLTGGELAAHPRFAFFWHPDCVLEELAEVPDGATYRGREAICGFSKAACATSGPNGATSRARSSRRRRGCSPPWTARAARSPAQRRKCASIRCFASETG